MRRSVWYGLYVFSFTNVPGRFYGPGKRSYAPVSES